MGWGTKRLSSFAVADLTGLQRTLGPQSAAGGATASACGTSHTPFPTGTGGRLGGPKTNPVIGGLPARYARRVAQKVMAALRAVEPPEIVVTVTGLTHEIGKFRQMDGQSKGHLIGHMRGLPCSIELQAVPVDGTDQFAIFGKNHLGGYVACGWGRRIALSMADGRRLRVLIFYVDDPSFDKRVWLVAKPIHGWDYMGIHQIRPDPVPVAGAAPPPTQTDLFADTGGGSNAPAFAVNDNTELAASPAKRGELVTPPARNTWA